MILVFPARSTAIAEHSAAVANLNESRAASVRRAIRSHCELHRLPVDETNAAIALGLVQLRNGATAVASIIAGKTRANDLRRARRTTT